MTAAGDPGGVNPRLCIAVSSSSNPTNWYRWSEDVDASNPVYADSPTVGFNKTWIVVQVNLYYKSDFNFFRSEVYAYNKANLYANGSGQRTRLVFDPSLGGSQVPATMYDSNNLVVYFVENWNGRAPASDGSGLNSGYLRLYSLTGNIGSEKLNTTNNFGEAVFAEVSSTWAEFATNDMDILPQLGTTNKIYAGDASIQNVTYRDGLLYAAQTAFVSSTTPTNAVVQWWVINAGSGDVRHFGRIRDSSGANMFAYPSIAANRYNDALIGYSRFSPSQYASAAYSLRIFDDPTDELRTETLLKAGDAPYYVPIFDQNRWGDWSATVVDPVNDTDFWTIQEYAAPVNGATGGSRWGTWWGRVSPPSDLGVTMTGTPASAPAGTQITYTLLVTNKLEKVTSGVRLNDTLPAGVSYVSATSSRGSCTYSDGLVSCAIGTLSEFEDVSITITVTAGLPGFATNVATVFAFGPDLDSSDNTAVTSTEIISSADLQVQGTDSPDPVHLGNSMAYTLTISNRGPSSAPGVVMTSTLPASVTINTVTASQGIWSINGSVINFTLGVIDNARSAVITINCTPGAAGMLTNQVRIGANTFDNTSANNSTNIVSRVNARPVITQLGTQTISEDVPTAIPITISDAETPAASLQFSATSSNPALVPNQNIVPGGSGQNRTLTITSALNQFGSNTTTITVTVTDADAASSTMVFPINVTAVNDAPTISGPSNTTVQEDTATNLTFAIADVDNPTGALTLSANSGNQTLVPNSNINFSGSGSSRTVSILPATNRFGSLPITIIVSDGTLSSSNTFTLNVNAVNDPPTISTIDPQTTSEDVPTTNIGFTVADPETQPTNLTVTASSSDTTVVPNANIALVNLGNSRTIRVAPGTNQNGLVSITVRVSDGTNSQTTAFDLTILAVNDPPTLTQPANITTNEDAGVISVPLAGINSGAANENQTITVRASTSTPDLVENLQVSYTSPGTSGTLSFNTVTNAAGTALIDLVVSDGITADDITRQLQVVINGVNDPPTIDTIPNVTVLEDSGQRSITLTGITAGPANETGQTNLITARSSATGIVPHPQISHIPGSSTATLTFTPVANANGVATITVTLDDGRPLNSVTTTNFQITVDPVNDLPTISTIGPQRVGEDSISAPIPFNFRDLEPGTLTPAAFSSDQTLVPDANLAITGTGTNRNLTITPSPNQFGTATITVRVTDADGGSTTTTFSLFVEAVNDPPTLAAIANPAPIDEDAPAQTVNLSGISPGPSNESGQTVLITATSGNPSIVPHPTVNYAPPSTTASLTYTPVANATGSVVITVTVDDRQGSNNLATQTFTVRINPINDPPTISGDFEDKFTDEDVPLVLGNITVGDIETPAGNLTLIGSSSNPELVADSGITFSGSGATRTVTVRPLTNEFGSAFISITVSDGNGGTADAGFQVIVNEVDDPPLIAAPGTQTIAEDTASGAIPFWIDDVDTPLPSVSVTARSSNTNLIADGNITLGGSGTNRNIRVTPSPEASGSTTITLTANDGNAARTAQFTINVSAVNDPPTLGDIATLNILEDAGPQLITLTGVGPGAANETSDVITITATSSVPGLIPNSTGTNISGVWKLPLNPTANSNGTANITVTVNDGRPTNNTVSKSFTVNVQAVNDPPTLAAIGNLTLNEDAPQQTVTLTGISAGPGENQPLTISATSGETLVSLQPVSYTSGSSTAVLRFTVAPNSTGNATITVQVSDGALDAIQSFTVTVNPVNEAPTITGIGNLSTMEDTPISAQFTIADEETYAARLILSASSTNTALVPNANIVFNGSDANRSVTITPAANQFGITRITINVSDGTNSVSTAFNLSVTSSNDPPTLNPLPSIGLGPNAATQTINLTGISAGGGESQTLSVRVASSNPGLIPAPSSVTYTSPNATGSFVLNPDNQNTGSAVITVTVWDNGSPSNSVSQSFTVYVRDSGNNAAPTLTGLSNRTTPEDTPISIPFVVNDTATPVANLVLGAISFNPDLVPTNAMSIAGTTTNRTLTISPARDRNGSATITVWVLDSQNGYTASNFILQVIGTNDAPVISSIAPQTVDRGTNMAPVPFTIGDAETAAQNLSVAATSSNQGLLPNSNIALGGSGTNRSIMAYPISGQIGSSTITVTVTDANSVSTSTTFVLTVRSPQPPTLAIRRIGPNVELRWPTDAGLYTVQGRGLLNTGSWADIVATPSVSGTNYVVPQLITGTNKFFRLRN
ncbi:MAG TPA: tandem-95 repeat protein [Verrucomicrobiae bacterium]|nr:tandem-95 repeat protein [Verrucomicrobiae bacterium]